LLTHQLLFNACSITQLSSTQSKTMNENDDPTPVTITRGQLNQLSHAFNNYQAMTEQVQSLVTEVAQLRLLSITPATTPDIRTPQPAPSQVPKVLQPDPFTGDRLELDTYLTRCQHVFLTQPSLFLTEQHKVLYAASYLKGNAYSWIKPLIQEYAKGTSVPTEFTTFQKYSESLTRMYGDPDAVKSKTREINALYQTSSVSAYASEFRRLQAYVAWNDQALLDRFYDGLRDNVKDGLVHENPRPKTLETLITAALRIDARIYERILEKKSTSAANSRQGSILRQTTATKPTAPQTQPPVMPQSAAPLRSVPHDTTTPMELDHQRIPFTPDEKRRRVEYRKLNGLCLWCGDGQHLLVGCPTAPKPGDPRYREPHARTPAPSFAAQRTFNYVTDSTNGSIAPESTNGDVRE
jgi:Retrotransposon gag protein